MKYIQPKAMMIALMSEDVITASWGPVTINGSANYADSKDEVSFGDLTAGE